MTKYNLYLKYKDLKLGDDNVNTKRYLKSLQFQILKEKKDKLIKVVRIKKIVKLNM